MVAFLFISKIPIFWDFFIPIFAENKRWFSTTNNQNERKNIMHRTLISAAIIGIISIIPNAHAVVKCVNLSPSATTCSGNIMSSSGADWVATCTTNGSSISIRGVSACECSATASASGSTAPSIGTAKSSLKTCNSAGSLCYCKMVSPAVSRWIFVVEQENCQTTCAKMCANAFSAGGSISTAIIKSMFTSMSD